MVHRHQPSAPLRYEVFVIDPPPRNDGLLPNGEPKGALPSPSFNGAHLYVAESLFVGGFGPWRNAIDKVAALKPAHIVAGHQNKDLDDDAGRTIAGTRQYLDDADELLRAEKTALDSSMRRSAGAPITSRGLCSGRVPMHSTACGIQGRTSGRLSLPGGAERRAPHGTGGDQVTAAHRHAGPSRDGDASPAAADLGPSQRIGQMNDT